MAVPKRVAQFALVVVALALTVTGVVLAATDSNPSGYAKDTLVLNGYAPKSATLHVVISTGQAYSVTGDVNVNFVTNAIEAQLQFPMFFSATSVDLRLVNAHLYAGSANLSSIVKAPWIAIPVKQPSLFGVGLEMTKPDISLITALGPATVSRGGPYTTYSFKRSNVVLSAPSKLPVSMPAPSTVDLAITVGSQGELTSASLGVTSKTSTFSINVTVLSYNQAVNITAPPVSSVKNVTLAQIQKLFGSLPLAALLQAKYLANIGQIRLN
jgi:hypothetical protein